MNAPAKVGAFAASLALTFVATFGVARTLAPDALADHGATSAEDHGGHGEPVQAESTALFGLASASDGLRMLPESTTLTAGAGVPFRFRIARDDGTTLTGYRTLHERELHLIVVRRDLTGFQHLHPTRGADGVWTAALTLPGGGTWRAYADLSPAGGPEQLTLGTDLQVAGTFQPGSLPAAVTPSGDTVAFDRRNDRITVSVSGAGAAVTPDPYLGARGHLVAIRAGDLGYAHVHPETTAGPSVAFAAHLPPGTYGLFFDYSYGGAVSTATSTLEVQ